MISAHQLPLDLPFVHDYHHDNYLVAESNGLAYSIVMRWPDWIEPVVFLQGPKGSGKTHLAQIWKSRAQAQAVSVETLVKHFEALSLAQKPILIDGLSRMDLSEQRVLFHLINAFRGAKQSLLITSQYTRPELCVSLPDLDSRLRLATTLSLNAPDDTMLQALCLKLFSDRQITISQQALRTLTLHIDRSFERIHEVIGSLDRYSLIHKRPITSRLILELLTLQDSTADSKRHSRTTP